MLTLSKILCSHSRTVNSLSFAALLKAERGKGKHPFNFILCDPEDYNVTVPCVFHPLCLKTLPMAKILKNDGIPVVIEIWCIVFQEKLKFVEVTSLAVPGIYNENKPTEDNEMGVNKDELGLSKLWAHRKSEEFLWEVWLSKAERSYN